ncbi:galanin receptor type 1-like [Amphiura filiformis]|uniref:galanin receptor type 1-like n=1 Tax=Amphiura filiformis TaxID=82378 RepID=UPI003B21778A
MSTIDASYYTPLLTTSSTDTLFPTGETHYEVSTKETVLRIIYAVIGSLGILGNLTVCTVFIIRRKAFNSITNKLILNQSCIDLLNSIVFLTLRFGPRYLPHNSLGEFLCRFWYNEYVMWALFITSTVNLVCLSLERYFATCHPVKHRTLFSNKVPKIGIPCIWLAGFTYELYWAAVPVDYSCYPAWGSKGVQMFMGILLFICGYLLPISTMAFSYVSIIMMLRRRTQDRQKAAVSAFQKAKKNVTITSCLVFICYVVCWTPTEITYLMYNLGYPYDFTSTAHDVFVVVVLCNMITNPIIYAFKYQHFQKQFQKVFCVCCQNKVGDLGTVSVVVDPAGADASSDMG